MSPLFSWTIPKLSTKAQIYNRLFLALSYWDISWLFLLQQVINATYTTSVFLVVTEWTALTLIPRRMKLYVPKENGMSSYWCFQPVNSQAVSYSHSTHRALARTSPLAICTPKHHHLWKMRTVPHAIVPSFCLLNDYHNWDAFTIFQWKISYFSYINS